jgi:ComF family protein
MVQDFLNLLFPVICACCDQALHKHENCFCTACRNDLPLTKDVHIEENETKKVFYGRIPIEKASSLFYYEKSGIVQNLLHDLKYRGNQKIGEVLGNWHAKLLSENGWRNVFDCIVPVPIHKKRRRERGYNQVDKYADALANQLNAKCIKDLLLRNHKSRTQVFKNRIARTKVTQSDFFLTEIDIHKTPKHILLVDDIITTGATLEACSRELLKMNDVKISIASMALAK